MPSSACYSDLDRKSTRLNSSHLGISSAVFCLKKEAVALRTRTMQNFLDRLLMTSQAQLACSSRPAWEVTARNAIRESASFPLLLFFFYTMHPPSDPFPPPPTPAPQN